MDLQYIGKRIIAVVAQKPFNNGIMCKLIPFINLETQELIDPEIFYNDHEILTLTNSHGRDFIPGTLMSCNLEESKSNELKEDSSLYQADLKKNPEYVIRDKEGAEIFTFPEETEATLDRFRDEGTTKVFSHRPSKMIFLRVSQKVWGPFYTNLDKIHDEENEYECNIKADIKTNRIYCIDEEQFNETYPTIIKDFQVALDNIPIKMKAEWREEKIEYILPKYLKQILNKFENWKVINFKSVSKQISDVEEYFTNFTKQDRKQLKTLLRKFENHNYFCEQAKEAAQSLQELAQRLDNDSQEIDHVKTLLYKEYLEGSDKLADAEKKYQKKYVATHKREIQKQIGEKQKELDELEEEFQIRKSEIEQELQQRRTQEMNAWEEIKRTERAVFDTEKQEFQEKLAQKELELQKREENIYSTLEDIKQLSHTNMSSIISVFPFIQQMLSSNINAPTQQDEQDSKTTQEEIFYLPDVIINSREKTNEYYSEKEFLYNLYQYIQARGFHFDENDVRRFHTSVKCGDITILAGPSGVGKSSLALLYGDALAGTNDDISCTKMIHVNPSWIEKADILGYINTVTQDYVPAETNLFQHLIYAQEDYQRNDVESAIYPICFDEMNLAQIEHYFSDFMQILELPTDKRQLPCFSQDALKKCSMFAPYHTITLVPTLKFIGTVNFDETTRRLSDRLLDRANVIYLDSSDETSIATDKMKIPTFPRISYSLYSRWCKDGEMPENIQKILQKIKPALKTLGIVISPRVYCAMRKYIISSKSLDIPELTTLDEQLTQRVFSKVRMITNYNQIEALKQLQSTLEEYSTFPLSINKINELENQESLWHDSIGREL